MNILKVIKIKRKLKGEYLKGSEKIKGKLKGEYFKGYKN